MRPFSHLALPVLLLIAGPTAGLAQPKPEILARCKAATVLVEVTIPGHGSGSGSGFCIDHSGLFITNAHVVREAADGVGQVRLVLDIGQKSRRVLSATVLRADNVLDLALLKVEDKALRPLELAQESALAVKDTVTALGFPFGRSVTVGTELDPDMTIITSRITGLRRDKGELSDVQFDGQVNPGNSGGPLVDGSGRVVGVVVKTALGRGMNFAIPVGELVRFLEAPGVVFAPAVIDFQDRARPVTWTIGLVPPKSGAKLPEELTIQLRLASGAGSIRTIPVEPVGEGKYQVKLQPVRHDAAQKLELEVFFPDGQVIQDQVEDRKVTVGGAVSPTKKIHLSDLRTIDFQPLSSNERRAWAWKEVGSVEVGAIVGLGKVRRSVSGRATEVELVEASRITVRPVDAPPVVRVVEALVEVKRGTRVLASLARRLEFQKAPPPKWLVARLGTPPGRTPRVDDEGPQRFVGPLKVTGRAAGAGKTIQPPSVAMGDARTGGESGTLTSNSEVRRLTDHTNDIMDLALTPDGRLLLSCDRSGVVRVWELRTHKSRYVLKKHKGAVLTLAVSADSRRLLTAGEDQFLRLWDLKTGKLLHEVPGEGEPIMAAVFTAGGRRALISHPSGVVLDRDLEDDTIISRWEPNLGTVDTLTISRDGKRVLATCRLPLILEAATGREVRRFERFGHPWRAMLTPDGRGLFGSFNSDLVLHDVETGRELGRAKDVHQHKGIDAMALSSDGRILATASRYERTIRFWNARDLHPVGQIALDMTPGRGTFTLDGSHVLWACSDKTIRELRLPDSVHLATRTAAARPGDPSVRQTGGTVSDIVVAGGGRYLILVVNEGRALAIFDVNAADIVKRIPLASGGAIVTAGASSFVVAYPETREIERWDLEMMTRQGAARPLPMRGRLIALAMGSDSEGPIAAVWTAKGVGNAPKLTARCGLLDLQSLEALRMDSVEMRGLVGMDMLGSNGGSIALGPDLEGQVHARASAAGDLFGFFPTPGLVPTRGCFQMLSVEKGKARSLYLLDPFPNPFGSVVPGPDGLMVYTALRGPLDTEGESPSWWETRPGIIQDFDTLIPTIDPAYFLSLHGLVDSRRNTQEGVKAAIHSACGTRLLTVEGLDEMNDLKRAVPADPSDFTVEKRFHWIPSARLLITVPTTNDRLVLRRLDFAAALERAKSPVLFVTSPRTLDARAGMPLEHQLRARSLGGSIRYSLTDGPNGLAVTASGKLTWTPSKEEVGRNTQAVVRLVDPTTGWERMHQIEILVE
jgi:S1-C subfamily serine protease